MKKILIGVGVVLAVLVGFVLLVGGGSYAATAGAREQAEKVMAAVRSGDEAALATLMHEALQKEVAPPKAMHMLRVLGFGQTGEVKWTEWAIDTDTGARLAGTLQSSDPVVFEMKFASVDDAWKLTAFERDLDDSEEGTDIPLPASEVTTKMVADTTRAFGAGVRARTFRALYDDSGTAFRTALTPEEFDDSFRAFIEADVDVSPAAELEPQFEPAPRIEEGVLHLQGRYPTEPSSVWFDYEYAREKGTWKLIGLKVTTKLNEPG